MGDIHHYAARVESGLRTLEGEKVPDEDKAALREFLEHLQVKGISDGRRAKYLFALMVLRRHFPPSCKDFRAAGRPDIERVVSWLNSAGYTAQTRGDMKILLRQFYRWLRSGNTDRKTPFPNEVAWIEKTIKANETELPEFLTEEEGERLIAAAPSLRDKAFCAFDYEGGFRIGEALGVRVSDLTFTAAGVRVRVGGKTGQRNILLVSCVPLLARYLDNHPRKGEPGAPLWVHSGTRNRGGPFSYAAASKMLRLAAQRAGLSKKVHTHTLRHSAATRDAKFLSHAELCVKFGWAFSSRMPAVYIHLAGMDLDAKIIAISSGRQVEPPKPKFTLVICPRCKENNSPGQGYCGKCGTPLRPDYQAKASIELQELKSKLDELLSRLPEARDNVSRAS